MAAANRRALALGLLARSAMSRATPTGPCVGDPIARQWWDHRRSRLSEPALWATNARQERNITVAHRVRHKKSDNRKEHTSELQSLMRISYAVFCLKQKKKYN